MDGDPNTTTRIGLLRNTVLRYRERYGDVEEFRPIEKLDRAITAKRARLAQLEDMAADLKAEIVAIETEISGIEKGIEALIGDAVPAVERRFGEAWSPTPVYAYRLWAWKDGQVHGVRERWSATHMRATCEGTTSGIEIPHSDGRCGRLGCGIYASKDAHALLTEFAPALRSGFIVGLVALTGKLVEHERGYRAEEARVEAVVAVDRMQAEFVTDRSRLDAVFDGAALDREVAEALNRDDLFTTIVDFLTDQEGKRNPWT